MHSLHRSFLERKDVFCLVIAGLKRRVVNQVPQFGNPFSIPLMHINGFNHRHHGPRSPFIPHSRSSSTLRQVPGSRGLADGIDFYTRDIVSGSLAINPAPRFGIPFHIPVMHLNGFNRHAATFAGPRALCITRSQSSSTLRQFSRSCDSGDYFARGAVAGRPPPAQIPDPEVFDPENDCSKAVMSRRSWEKQAIYNPRHMVESFLPITVMSYNVLSQHLLEVNRYLYKHSRPEVLTWEHRSPRIIAEIVQHEPSVVCLQEVDEQYFESFYVRQLRQHGYEGLFIKRTGSDKFDGCATFYKTGVFRLDSYKEVKYKVPFHSVMDRDNVGLIVRLTPVSKKVKTKLCVANTHLLFNQKRGDVKLAQLAMLLAELHKLALTSETASKRPTYHPCIVCGDFNSVPFSPLYKFLIEGAITYKRMEKSMISGQNGGRSRSVQATITENILPEWITQKCTITDNASTVDVGSEVASARPARYDKQHSGLTSPSLENRSSGVLIDTVNAEGHRVQATNQPGSEPGEESQPEWGTLTHGFNFVSSYRFTQIQRLGYVDEVTSHHGSESCCVDYIMHTVDDKKLSPRCIPFDIRSGKLRFVSRYGLLSSEELSRAGSLPNAHAPSDHLSIVAKFLLL